MHYFSLHTQTDEHIGFLIMEADDENGQTDCGQFAVKLLGENPNAGEAEWRGLAQCAESENALFWRAEGDRVGLYDADGQPLGTIRQQWLLMGQQRFVLNDLTGVL